MISPNHLYLSYHVPASMNYQGAMPGCHRFMGLCINIRDVMCQLAWYRYEARYNLKHSKNPYTVHIAMSSAINIRGIEFRFAFQIANVHT